MEDYRERLRTGRVISDAIPLQQWLPEKDVEMVEVDVKAEEAEGGDSPQTPDNESSSGQSDSEDDDKTAEKDLDVEASPVAGLSTDSGIMGRETSAEAAALELHKTEVKVRDKSVGKVGNVGEENSGKDCS